MRSRHGYYYGRSPDFRHAPVEQRVLVALVPTLRDWHIVHEHGWYRLPVRSAPQPMRYGYIAFYQTKGWGQQDWAINWWARIAQIREVARVELLPHEAVHPRASERYYRLDLTELRPLPTPIPSRRRRFIVFISTTLDKFVQAREINDLFCESPLEDLLWEHFRRHGIEAERQWYVSVGRATYCLDFAIFCTNGKIDVECDGDFYHANPEKAREDNQRNNYLTSAGWEILRFTSQQILETPSECVQMVCETANQYGGLLTTEGETRWFPSQQGGGYQLNLFAKEDRDPR
ncbi:hypothetical protein HRbin15_01431 [bacterium HR15]|nr:hypothetical protein HRbin15_01431 [bacterium HR15]